MDEEDGSGAPWAKLVKCSEKEKEYFSITKSSHTIGRNPGRR